MASHIRFASDDESEYNPSDSDQDYTEKEKELLQKVRNRKLQDSDSDDEVYPLMNEEDEGSDENNSDIALSDVEGQDDRDDLPDIRAWGKDKRKFYSTDFVDPDYGGFQGKTATLAELEEVEAKNLQKQLVQELDDGDFSLEMFVKNKELEHKDQLEEVVKTDVSKLSKRQKLQLIKQESPEFFELIEDYKARISLAKETLRPVLDLQRNEEITYSDALDFVKFYYQLVLNYTTNISMYLLLKSSKINLKNHPIIKRLFQYRQLLLQMDGVFDDVVRPQLEVIMNKEENVVKAPQKKKMLKLLKTIQNKATKEGTNEDIDVNEETAKEVEKHVRFADDMTKYDDGDDDDDDESLQFHQIEEAENQENMEDGGGKNTKLIDGKRPITYQMAKNKGLTPHRKKEQRNPRVKHRNKFRKAKIRRKGAVREVRKELSRYSGEISGIKASVSKSIKLMS